MKVKDEAVWREQLAELARTDDPKIGKEFVAILEEWTTLAERLHERCQENGAPDVWCEPLGCLRETLPTVEQNHRALSGLWIFEMLLVMDSVWIYGGELYEALTSFERAALGDVARSILREAQQDAETVPSGPEK